MSAPARPVKRRRALKYTLLGLGGLTLACCGAVGGLGSWLLARTKVDTVDDVDFGNPLHVPELAEAQVDSDGRRVFDLELGSGSRQFKSGAKTNTWGINGDYLGPTLRAARGETVRVNVSNGLPESTSLHWHGMHLPAAMDGGPHQSVAPDAVWRPEWTIDQPAASLWYHPHPHEQTARHVYRGLAGMFILDDEVEAELDLPREYGVDDVPLIVQDRQFGDDGQFDEDSSFMGSVGVLGDELLVNGTHSPYLEVRTQRVRLRLLNGSNARTYNFGFADDREFDMIASDGGLLSRPHRTDRIQLTPAERAEIVVEFSPAETVVLRSYEPDLETDFFQSNTAGGADRFDVLQFRAAAELRPSPALPEKLTEIEPLDVSNAKARSFDMSGFDLNDKAMDMSRIDFGVKTGATEVWEIENRDGNLHNFHVHDVRFQVLSVGGEDPPPQLRGWKDTVPVFSQSKRVRIAMRFDDFADPDMPYMCHCHILFHEDQGLMGQFVVLEEGQEIGSPPTSGGHDHD
ncbi:MAG: multicopper oxidase family protein [Stackebrandtia sp.]